MSATQVINEQRQDERTKATIPSIALNAGSPRTPKLPPLTPEEVRRAVIFLRILQSLPSRRTQKQERAQTVLSAPHSKDEYQSLWRVEINDHLVNHPKSQLRKLFKRPRENANPGNHTTSKVGPPPSSRGVDRIQFLRRLNESLPVEDTNNDDFNSAVQDWEADKVKLEHVFLQPRVWKSWQYKCAYPRLAAFLVDANHEYRSRCEVNMRDFPYEEEENCLDEWNSVIDREVQAPRTKVQRAASDHTRQRLRLRRQTVLNHEKLWEHIRSRFKTKGRRNYRLGRSDSSYIVPCRVLQVVDLSPNCACLLLESSARVDLSYVAMFMERHLMNLNWATVNLITNTGPNSKLRNYLFEYHISFYHVTSGHTNLDDDYGDERNARKVSPFTAGPKAKARRIYEEQLSFITIGHGGDVYTNFQLAEKYSCDPNDDLYESPFYVQSTSKREDDDLNRFEEENRGIAFFVSRLKPSSAFLAWIANSMRHVVARWQTAILAVDRETESDFQATFHGDKHSLLADDSSFSRSKRYVWAIQVYGVFSQKLDETINVWKDFEKSSLERLDQDQLVTHKEESLTIIKAAVTALEMKRDHVRDRRREVSDMKDALFATSQLLDSRNTVTQNENIRLLTYVNLLFLPLAFCTSIFGMQTILPAHVHGVYFAVTICIVTIFTIFMVFNLPHMIELVEGIMGKATKLLRKLMDAHHRRHWHKTAQALQTSREARKIIVQNRLRRNSAWMYFVFLLEVFFVMIPVHEIKAARRFWGLRKRLEKESRPSTTQRGLTGIPNRSQPEERDRGVVHSLAIVLLSAVRVLFLPLWLIIVGLEVAVISAYILMLYAFEAFYEALQFTKQDQSSITTTTTEKRKPKPHPFRIPLQLLGFYVEDELKLPPNIQRKVKRWRGIIAESQGDAVLHAAGAAARPDEDGTKPYFVHRSDAAKEEEMRARRLPSPSPPASPTGGLRVAFERGLRRMSEGNNALYSGQSASSSRPSPSRARTLSPGRFPQFSFGDRDQT